MSKKKIVFINKIVFYYTLIFSVIIFLIFSALYLYINQSWKNSRQLNNQIIGTESLKQLDAYLLQVNNTASQVASYPSVIRLYLEFKNNDLDDYYEKNILDSLDISSSLRNINGIVSPYWRISVYNEKGNFASTGGMVEEKIIKSNADREKIKETMDFFQANPDAIIVNPPSKDRWSSFYKANYISFVRPVKNNYSTDILGLVEIQEDITKLEKALSLSNTASYSLNIYDDNGRDIIVTEKVDMVTVLTIKSEKYNWTIELLESKSNIGKNKYTYIFIFILVWLTLTILVYYTMSLVGKKLSKPLIDLKELIEKTDIANIEHIPTTDTKIDEIAELEIVFDNLVQNLIFSMESEKKAFFQAIQSQMNPHFLYNTLSVISITAMENQDDLVVDMCQNLSNMLRYVSSYSDYFVNITEEIAHTKSYLNLMKERYDYMFSYNIIIDGDISNIKIPKLIIQPLCENCFVHGFVESEPPYRIDVKIYAGNEKSWYIEVIDNGKGFDEKEKHLVLDKINLSSYEDIREKNIGGLGIGSSVARLKIFTGKDVNCIITNNKLGGSSVKIIVM